MMSKTVDYLTPIGPPGSRNLRTRLLVGGILLILSGTAVAGLSFISPIPLIVNGGWQTFNRQWVDFGVDALASSMVASAFIWTGIGSIRFRRWVRPIVLAWSMIWLVSGLLIMVDAVAVVYQSAVTVYSPYSPPSGLRWHDILLLACLTVPTLLIPATLALLYRPVDVAQTSEFYDRVPRWTDPIPIPILTLGFACSAAAIAAALSTPEASIECIGVVFTGPAAVAVRMLTVGLFAAAALLLLRMKPAGWTLAVVLIILDGASMVANAVLIKPRGPVMTTNSNNEHVVEVTLQSSTLVTVVSIIVATLTALTYAIYARRFIAASSISTKHVGQS